MKMKTYIVRKMQTHKGALRVYLDLIGMADAGFSPGQSYVRDISTDAPRITLRAQESGTHVVSRKEQGSRTVPIIDINSTSALIGFEGMAAVRIIVQNNRIDILPLASETKRLARLERLRASLDNGVVTTAGLSFGGGVLDHAAHAGLMDAGLQAELVVANEIDEGLLAHATLHNDTVTSGTVTIAAPIQEFVQDDWAMKQLPTCDLLALGLPCSGASQAGKSKRGLTIMEQHPEVGHLVASAIMVINRIQPSCLVLENVTQYADSASAHILRSHLRDSGYTVQETTLSAQEFGSLENRHRWFLVASTVGIDIDLTGLAPTLRQVHTLSEVLEPIGTDAADWRTFDYLKAKEVRDAAKGNSFAMQVVTPASTSVPVIRKGYAKGGSTDALLAHPTDPNLLRQLTVKEHAAIKGVPAHLVEGLSKTDGHAILGQGVDYATVRALFARIGKCLVNWKLTEKSAGIQDIGYSLRLATG